MHRSGGFSVGFTAKRGNAVRNISLVPEDAGQKAGNLLNKIVGDARYERLRVWNRERKARRKD